MRSAAPCSSRWQAHLYAPCALAVVKMGTFAPAPRSIATIGNGMESEVGLGIGVGIAADYEHTIKGLLLMQRDHLGEG